MCSEKFSKQFMTVKGKVGGGEISLLPRGRMKSEFDPAHWVTDKYSNPTSMKDLFELLESSEAYVKTKWKSKDLLCYKLLEAMKMFRLILAALIVWDALVTGKYIYIRIWSIRKNANFIHIFLNSKYNLYYKFFC